MKVVQINVCGTLSTGRIAIDISKTLNEKGIENYIFYGYGTCDYPLAKKISSDIYIKTNVLKTRLFGKHGFYSKIATYKLIKSLREIAPDIVHLQNIHGHYLNMKILFDYLKRENLKVVWTFHDCWPFTGHCAYFDYANCDKWKTGCYKCPSLKDYPISWFFDRSKESYVHKKEVFTSVQDMVIVTPSSWLAKLAQESYFKDYKIKVINNGIDLTVFKPRKSDFRKKNNLENKFMILGIAQGLMERKGYKYFIELAGKLDENYQIVLVGISDAQKSIFPENVITIPRTDNAQSLAEIYTAADVFVNPTLEDNFPTTNIEALACGTPIITFNSGGSPESVDTLTGVVVEKGNTDELINAIKKLKQIGKSNFEKHCIEKARQNYNSKNKYGEYVDLYTDIFGG